MGFGGRLAELYPQRGRLIDALQPVQVAGALAAADQAVEEEFAAQFVTVFLLFAMQDHGFQSIVQCAVALTQVFLQRQFALGQAAKFIAQGGFGRLAGFQGLQGGGESGHGKAFSRKMDCTPVASAVQREEQLV